MSIVELLLIVAALGAVGGFVNALMTDNGFLLPKSDTVDGTKIWRPGFLGNVIIGAVAAAVFWGLYGPLAEVTVVGDDPGEEEEVRGATRDAEEDDGYGETLGGLAGTFLIGLGGARFLTQQVDKKLLQLAAAKAQQQTPNPDTATTIATASPAKALEAASGHKMS